MFPGKFFRPYVPEDQRKDVNVSEENIMKTNKVNKKSVCTLMIQMSSN